MDDTANNDVTWLDDVPIRLRRSGRRADLILSDPDRHNPQSPSQWRALAGAGAELDGQVDVVVLRGAGSSFSAGLDRSAFMADSAEGFAALGAMPAELAMDRIAQFQEAFRIWSECSFVSIAAVHGHAIGAGFQLALACDLRIAADDVRFSMKEPSLGLVPDLGGTARLVEAVGYARALEICATSRTVTADQAERYGLVQQVVRPDELDEAVDALAAHFLGEQAGAVLATRDLLRRRRDTIVDQLEAERSAQLDRIRALSARA